MSVLIKMDMPKSCSECQLLEGDQMDGLCHAANKWLDDDYFRWFEYDEGDIDDSKPLNCPIVEIPPHGRLIDADAFIKENWYFVDKDFIDSRYDTTLRELVADASTVIPEDHIADVSKKVEDGNNGQ